MNWPAGVAGAGYCQRVLRPTQVPGHGASGHKARVGGRMLTSQGRVMGAPRRGLGPKAQHQKGCEGWPSGSPKGNSIERAQLSGKV